MASGDRKTILRFRTTHFSELFFNLYMLSLKEKKDPDVTSYVDEVSKQWRATLESSLLSKQWSENSVSRGLPLWVTK